MTANHPRDLLDDIDDLARRVRELEGSRALGAQATLCTSTTRPAPTLGRLIFETDTGLQAMGNGTTWNYVPQLIAQQNVSSTTASVTFSGIPQNFTNLELILAGRSDGTGSSGYDTASVQFNGVTSGYNGISVYSIQGSTTAFANSGTGSAITCAQIWNAFFGTGGRGVARICIPNYSASSGMKGLTSLTAASDGGAAGVGRLFTGFSSSSAAVTSLKVQMNTGNFVLAEFSLYGS